jgi:hypothetical protein
LEEKFTFPRRILKRKPSETIKDFDETIKKLKTDLENHDRSNMKLKEKIKQINLSHLKVSGCNPPSSHRALCTILGLPPTLVKISFMVLFVMQLFDILTVNFFL